MVSKILWLYIVEKGVCEMLHRNPDSETFCSNEDDLTPRDLTALTVMAA